MTKPIRIFYHLNDLPGAFDLMSEQLSRMEDAGLLDAAHKVMFCTNGTELNFRGLMDVMGSRQNVMFQHVSNRTDHWEYPTLELLRKNAVATMNDDEEFYVCYIHLKGLSRPGDQRVTDWRNFMEHYTIDKWKECVAHLDAGYDLVGTNIIEQPWLHSSGNFWWSRSGYVKKLPALPDPTKLQWGTTSPYTQAVYDPGNFRYDHEAWIASGSPTWVETASTPGKQTPGWHFDNLYPESEYVKSAS